jgi:DNA-directed RNA polymerase subunit RPC12/RpoP
MALIKCAECSKEISDQAPSCPHCGAPVKPNAKVTATSKQTKVATAIFWVLVIGFFLWVWSMIGGSHDAPATAASSPAPQASATVAAPPEPEVRQASAPEVAQGDNDAFKVGVPGQPCSKTLCESGAKVSVRSSKVDPAFACPTKELTLYTNLVYGLFTMSVALGRSPNISPVTGEPEYPDGPDGKPNETRLTLERLRGEANVSTFDEAIGRCQNMKNKTSMVVLNYPKDGGIMWVSDSNVKNSYWIAKSSLIRQ